MQLVRIAHPATISPVILLPSDDFGTIPGRNEPATDPVQPQLMCANVQLLRRIGRISLAHCYDICPEPTMNMTLTIAPIISLIAGIIILVAPRFLNYIVAIYLIVMGLLGLFGGGNFHLQ
jgi:hypothetical protein